MPHSHLLHLSPCPPPKIYLLYSLLHVCLNDLMYCICFYIIVIVFITTTTKITRYVLVIFIKNNSQSTLICSLRSNCYF